MNIVNGYLWVTGTNTFYTKYSYENLTQITKITHIGIHIKRYTIDTKLNYLDTCK